MPKLLQILLTLLIGLLTGFLSFTAAFALYMCVYIKMFGSFNIEIFFGSNKLENPVIWASIVGAAIGFAIGFFIFLLLSIFEFRTSGTVPLISSLLPFAFFFFVYAFFGGGGSAKDSNEIIKLSLISLIPSLITGLVISKFITYLRSPITP